MFSENWRERIAAPFSFDDVSFMPVQKKQDRTKAQAGAYLSGEKMMARFDEAIGPENWQCSYRERTNGKELICQISVFVNAQWVVKEGTGESEASAFRQAANKWGVGRWIKELPKLWVDCTPVGDKNVSFKREDLKGAFARFFSVNGASKPAGQPAPAPKPAPQPAAPAKTAVTPPQAQSQPAAKNAPAPAPQPAAPAAVDGAIVASIFNPQSFYEALLAKGANFSSPFEVYQRLGKWPNFGDTTAVAAAYKEALNGASPQ